MAYDIGYPTDEERESLAENAARVGVDIHHIIDRHVNSKHGRNIAFFTGEWRQEAQLLNLIKTTLAKGQIYSSKDEMGFVIPDKFEVVKQCQTEIGKKFGDMNSEAIRLILRTNHMHHRTDWKHAFVVTAFPD